MPGGLQPGLPQPVDIGMVQPEDRVEPGRGGVRHQSDLERIHEVIVAGAADVAVDVVVRALLEQPFVAAAAVLERCAPAAEAGRAADLRADEAVLQERGVERNRPRVERDRPTRLSGRSVSRHHEERVGAAVGPRLRSEGGRKMEPIGVALVIVVPVGQRPAGWPAKLHNRGSDDPLECAQIAAVPGEEIPGVMLALVAVLAPERDCTRQVLARLHVAVAAPELLGGTVHRGEIAPACHVAEGPRAHHFDRARVPSRLRDC